MTYIQLKPEYLNLIWIIWLLWGGEKGDFVWSRFACRHSREGALGRIDRITTEILKGAARQGGVREVELLGEVLGLSTRICDVRESELHDAALHRYCFQLL